jgi:ketosteroid isomerase-like protein
MGAARRRVVHALGLTLALALLASDMAGCRRSGALPATPEGIVVRWIDAWNSKDSHALLSLFDEDAIFWWPSMALPIRGKKEIERYITNLWAGWAEIEMHHNTTLRNDEDGKVAIDWTLTFRDVRSGRPVRLQGVDLLQVRNGVVTGERGIFNACDLLQQMKPVPTPGAVPAPAASPS